MSLWQYKGIIEYNLLVKVTSRRRLLPFICNNVRSAESKVYLNLIYCPRHMSSPHIIVLWRLSGEERIDCILLGPRQLPQWSLFLKTIRWSWYSNRFRFGQFSLLMQNIENVNIGDESNVPSSLDSKDLNSAGQTDIIDNITRLK